MAEMSSEPDDGKPPEQIVARQWCAAYERASKNHARGFQVCNLPAQNIADTDIYVLCISLQQ